MYSTISLFPFINLLKNMSPNFVFGHFRPSPSLCLPENLIPLKRFVLVLLRTLETEGKREKEVSHFPFFWQTEVSLSFIAKGFYSVQSSNEHFSKCNLRTKMLSKFSPSCYLRRKRSPWLFLFLFPLSIMLKQICEMRRNKREESGVRTR